MKWVLLALLILLPAQAAYAADMMVKDAWVRLMPPVAQNSAVYMTLKNMSDADIRIVDVSTDAASSNGFHTMRMQDGKMVMHHVDSVIVPAQGEFSFVPGGFHIMLAGLSRELHEKDVVNVVLTLADGGHFTLQAVVRDMRMGHGQHGGMH